MAPPLQVGKNKYSQEGSNPLLSMPPADRRRGQRNDAMHRPRRDKNAEAFLNQKAELYRQHQNRRGRNMDRSNTKNRKSRIAAGLCSLLLALAMLFSVSGVSSLLTVPVFAVTGSTVAADGVYSSPLTAYKYKYGKLDKSYTGTLNVAVSDGEIAGLWVSNASSDKMSKLITNEIYYTYVGQKASVSAVQATSGVDAVSGASVAGSTSSVNSSVKKQYVADIQGAIVKALGNASSAPSSSSGSTSTTTQTVQGMASVSDSEGSKLVLDVGLDSDGKIVSLTVNDSSVSDWSSIVSKNAASYVGKTAGEIDAVSGATPYTTAVNTAVLTAMEKAGATSGGNSGESGSGTGGSGNEGSGTGSSEGATGSGKTISPDGSATIAVGETVTLDGTHNSMASSESWSSSNTSVATVAASGGYDSDATVTGVSAGTATITHTINSLFGSSTETFTITVTGSGSDSGSGSGTGSGSSDPSTGVTSITVTKEWKNDSASDRPSSVTVGIYNGSTKVQTLTLNAQNSWTATATGLNSSVEYTVKEDAVEGYTSTVTKEEDTTGTSGSSGWTAQSYGAVEAGKTYAFTYTSNGTTYLLGRNGTSVIGTTSGLSGGVPTANIGNDYKWTVSSASSSYGNWYLKNNGSNYFLAVGSNYSTGYQPGAYLNSSESSYYGAMHLDNDGSIWNGYYPGYNLYASGASVGADSKSFTVFTPYIYAEGGSAVKTANYTITNTKDESTGGGTGGGSGSGSEGGEDEEPADPTHVKAITPEGITADNYTITLNVTGQSKTTTSTTQTGESTTSPYDILLVLDNTLSMAGAYGSTTRLAAMRTAAQSFVDGLPNADGSKIAMASFIIGNYQSPTTTNVNWTDLSAGKSSVKTQIGQLTAPESQYGYDTCFTQPLERASSLLDSVSSDGNKKFVVFFTDGAATETVSTIQSLASTVKGKADATFSIGIVSGSTETQKAQALASSSENYYDVTSAGTMGGAFTSALTTIQSQTTVTKVPMTGVAITDTLSKYVELSSADTDNYGVTLEAKPEDSSVSIENVNVEEKEVKVTLSGNLKDETVYTISIPVKPSEAAQTEANENDDAVSAFVSNSGATLTYQYESETAKTTEYTEQPKIYVAKQLTLTYDANAGGETVTNMPDPVAETKAFADADADYVEFSITNSAPARDGFSFKGWASSAAAETAQYSATDTELEKNIRIAADTTLYAIWEEDKVTLTYDANAGDDTISGMPDPVSVGVKKNETTEITTSTPIRVGYTFLGWTDDANVSEAKYTSENGKNTITISENTTLYAVWRQDYRLIFEDYTNGGVSISGIETTKFEGHPNCRIGTAYVNGKVTFTLNADMAVVAAIHSDGSLESLMDQNGNYSRLFCTADHSFTVDVSEGDVYIVLAYKGDVNLVGEVEIWDSTLANRIYVETYPDTTKLKRLVGDVDSDGEIEIWDSTMINRAYVETYTINWDLNG